jgi:hypothetical protein
MKVRVGQIVLLEHRKSRSLIPARVEEEVRRSTLEGEFTSYMISVPGQEGLFDLEKVDMPYYLSFTQARDALLESAKVGIEAIIQRASQLSVKHFSTSEEPLESPVEVLQQVDGPVEGHVYTLKQTEDGDEVIVPKRTVSKKKSTVSSKSA